MPGDDHVAVLHRDDPDAHGVGGQRVLADRPGARSPARAEQPDLHYGEYHVM